MPGKSAKTKTDESCARESYQQQFHMQDKNIKSVIFADQNMKSAENLKSAENVKDAKSAEK